MRWLRSRRRLPARHLNGQVVYSPSPGPVAHQCPMPWASEVAPGTVWQCECTRRWESRKADAPTVTRRWWREMHRDEPLPGAGDHEEVPMTDA